MAKEEEKDGKTTAVAKRPARAVKAASTDDQAPDWNPDQFIPMAMEKGYPPETIKEFLGMRRELKAEWAREQYYQALSRFQAECPDIPKTVPVYNKDGTLRYRYAPIDTIIRCVKPALTAYGFSYTIQPVQEQPGQVSATVIAHHVAGHVEQSTFTVPVSSEDVAAKRMNATQAVGAARSYAKRYAFCDVFGIINSDEDIDAADDPSPHMSRDEQQLATMFVTMGSALENGYIRGEHLEKLVLKTMEHLKQNTLGEFLRAVVIRVDKAKMDKVEEDLDAEVRSDLLARMSAACSSGYLSADEAAAYQRNLEELDNAKLLELVESAEEEVILRVNTGESEENAGPTEKRNTETPPKPEGKSELMAAIDRMRESSQVASEKRTPRRKKQPELVPGDDRTGEEKASDDDPDYPIV